MSSSSEPSTKKQKTMASNASEQKSSDSWVEYDSSTCDFPIQNLPYGIFQPTPESAPRCGTAIGDFVLDLSVLHEVGMFQQLGTWTSVFCEPTLNNFMALGSAKWAAARAAIARLLDPAEATLRDNSAVRSQALVPMLSVIMSLPCRIGDFTDFYASREHATNVGTMFRGADNALQPNWLRLPVGYHGRSSSVVVSGTPIRRPRGQLQADRTDPTKGSNFGPCRLLDFELEVGCFVGPGNELGDPIDINKVEDHVFGFVLLNDWSGRCIFFFSFSFSLFLLSFFLLSSFSQHLSHPFFATKHSARHSKVGVRSSWSFHCQERHVRNVS
jgi:fumarylacetoacetase